MSTIITREGKGSELEWTELDANFTNLNADKVEITAVNDAVLVETTARIAGDALLAPKATTYTKTEVDAALIGKASAANNTGVNTGDQTLAGLGGITYSDLSLYKDAANTLAQRNSTNSQTFRLYNTYPDASNYERATLGFAVYGGVTYAKLAVEGGGTSVSANIGIALSPKGTGAITAQVPDGTTAGGNARGVNSVDLQTVRGVNTQVASGSNSVIIGGYSNTASGATSVVLGGSNCKAEGSTCSVAGGWYNVASGKHSIAVGGATNIASGEYASVHGYSGVANKRSQVAIGLDQFTTVADMQYSYLGFAGATTTATTTEIFLSNQSNIRATIPNNTTWAADIDIVARSSGGTENAYFKRRLVIQKGTTAASTALIGSVELVSTIASTGASTWAVTLSADTTNGALKLEVTGVAATNIRWVAKVSLVEVGFA